MRSPTDSRHRSSGVEQLFRKQQVVGSNPTGGSSSNRLNEPRGELGNHGAFGFANILLTGRLRQKVGEGGGSLRL